MTMHFTLYAEWTYDQVRARIIEAAETLIMQPKDLGPGLAGTFQEVVRLHEESYGYGTAGYRRIPTAGALTRMEETWSWINTWLDEPERKLVYEYSFIMTRKGLNIAGWCEKNGWVKRTFERRVNRACHRIAGRLNQAYKVRLGDGFDGLSQNQAHSAAFTVGSDTSATARPERHRRYEMSADARPANDCDTEEGAKAFAHHLKAVNRRRQNQARRAAQRAAKRKMKAAA